MTVPTPPPSDANPFRAPAARVADAESASVGQLLAEPRQVAAGASGQWLVRGWEMFKAAPGPWIGMFVLYLVVLFGVGMIPVVGVIGSILGPILVAGLLMAADGQANGQPPTVGQVFDGFKRNTGALAMVGLLYLGVVLALSLVVGVGMVGVFGAVIASGGEGMVTSAAVVSAALLGGLLFLLVGPLSFSIMWAPALVALHDMAALPALKLSVAASIRNWLPLLVFLLWGFVMLIPIVLTLGLGALVLGPVGFLALWVGYRAIFVR